jgi:hypothetical protein
MSVDINIDYDKLKKAHKKAQDLALTSIGIFGQEKATKNTPVDSGRLRASISYRVGKDKSVNYKNNANSESWDDDLDKTDEDRVLIGTNVEYAKKIEFGYGKVPDMNVSTTMRSRNKSPDNTGTGFLRRAFDENRNTIKKIAENVFDKVMR